MVGDHPIYIAFRKQFGKFGGTELLQRHHPAELADGFIVQRIKEDLSDFFNQQLLSSTIIKKVPIVKRVFCIVAYDKIKISGCQ